MVFFVLTTTACASEEADIPLERVIDSDQIFTVEILRSAGMKTSKQYDVTDLPGGIDAWYGFIKGVTGPKDIEARFYNSHQDAVELGTALAEEVSGDDANVDKETTTWKEGVKIDHVWPAVALLIWQLGVVNENPTMVIL